MTPPVSSDGNKAKNLNLHRWRPGQSGNPAGVSISLINLALEVRRATRGGRELVELQLAIARGEKISVPGRRQGRGGRGEAQFQRPNLDQRMAAIAWLADRGFGRAKEVIELTGEPSAAQRLEMLRRLSEDERTQLRQLLERALNGASVTANDATDGTPALPSPTDLEEATTSMTSSTSTATGHDEQSDSDLPPSDTTSS